MRRLATLALLVSLSSPILAVEDSPFYDAKAEPSAQLASYVDGLGTERLKGLKRVLVPQFRVEFQLRTEAGGHFSNRSSSTPLSSQRNVSVYLHLKGVEDDQLQSITDQAYQDFLKQMAGAGIEVIGPDKLAAEPEFAAVLQQGKPSPVVLETKDGISHFFAPKGGVIYTLLRSSDQDRQGFTSGLATGTEDMTRQIPAAELALSKKYGAPCMKVLLTMAPGQATISGWNGIGLLGDAVTLINGTAEILPALTMLEESRMVFRSPEHSANDSTLFGGRKFFGSKVRDFAQEGDTAIFLKKPLLMASQISTKKMEDTTGAGSRVMNAATTVNKVAKVGGLAGALGGFVPFGGLLAPATQVAQVAEITGNHDHHEYTIEADKTMFESAAKQEIAATIRLLMARTTQSIAADAGASAKLAAGEKKI